MCGTQRGAPKDYLLKGNFFTSLVMTRVLYSAFRLGFLLWLFWLPGPVRATMQSAPAQGTLAQELAGENPFFTSEQEFRFTLVLPIDDILRDRGANPALHAATLLYQDETGKKTSLPVQVRVRGNRRKDPTVCDFPPLLISFPKAFSASTPFGKVQELKMTTHCLEDSYVLREYLVYKLYNALTTMSFRARLCRVTYQDANGKRKSAEHQSFLLEEASAMALRNKATIIPKLFFIGMQHTDQRKMAMVAFFQYMIGNTDWSVPYRHNIRLLSPDKNATCIPVPYDFDYCGLVMTPYAEPPPQLGITSVRQRLFRGYGFSEEIYKETRTLFNDHQKAFYNIYELCPYLSKDEKLFASRFLEDFYKTLNDPKDFERNIVRVGRRNEKQYTNIKGL
ncbi:hypothetical protein SAMN06265337_2790 [Hymenobacter gelipurpurascens]|uniref:Uncharacterized protein n=2 Tax=Hymenobacter gelipurpurascens TaxID=89968 RepID=A0A212UAL9_9BACT|nr:hypothetical protein SAMN06265337_2790 [Hymenobacter gelipurpurascens]